VVLSGRAVADEAMLTGEAALVPKHTGDRVSSVSHSHPAPLCTQLLASTGSLLARVSFSHSPALSDEDDGRPWAVSMRR
jgi:cation transport ATPase